MLDQMAATAYKRWPPGIRKTLTLYKKIATPIGDTADPYGTGITYTACRRREVTTKLMLVYGPIIGVGRKRLFEAWIADKQTADQYPADGDVWQEADGTRWTIKVSDEIILDHCYLTICIPEV